LKRSANAVDNVYWYYSHTDFQLLNAKVAFKLFRKLGVVDITHAKDGIEGGDVNVVS
jgi:hypothetical protein